MYLHMYTLFVYISIGFYYIIIFKNNLELDRNYEKNPIHICSSFWLGFDQILMHKHD